MFSKIWHALHAVGKVLSHRFVMVPAILAVTTLCLCASAFSVQTYFITDGVRTTVYSSYEKDATQAVLDAGKDLGEYDKILTSSNEDGSVSVSIMRAGTVSITADGVSRSVNVSYDDTVETAMARAGLTLGESDEVVPAMNSTVEYGENISVLRITFDEITRTVSVPYRKETRPNNEMTIGATKVVQKGVNGSKTQTVKVKKSNGVAVAEEVLSETVLSQPTNKIVERGTKVVANISGGAGELPVSRDGALRYSKVIDVVATAYCPCYQCSGGWGTKTASGIKAKVGVIAVDPRIIPLGTRVYVTSADGKSWYYGYAVAGDTGGAIKGNRIDLFFNSHYECVNFGRRSAKVYILE